MVGKEGKPIINKAPHTGNHQYGALYLNQYAQWYSCAISKYQ